MKDTKHIRRDFHSVPWVMPQGSDLGALGVPRGSFFFSNMVMWHIKSTGVTSKRSNIIKFQLPCQFQRFLYQTLCVVSQMKDTKHIRRVMPQGSDLGGLGVPRGQFFFFKHGPVAYQINGDDKQNRMQVKSSS